jgi:adenosyl cobinamide kinase/adenosyl cobinamide phosphate guanylyltransferase
MHGPFLRRDVLLTGRYNIDGFNFTIDEDFFDTTIQSKSLMCIFRMQYLIEQEIRKIDQYKTKLIVIATEVCLDLIPAAQQL